MPDPTPETPETIEGLRAERDALVEWLANNIGRCPDGHRCGSGECRWQEWWREFHVDGLGGCVIVEVCVPCWRSAAREMGRARLAKGPTP